VKRGRYAAAVSEHPVAASAVGEVVGQVLETLAGPADLACLFVSTAHVASIGAITAAVRDLLGAGTLVGCSAQSVIGGPQEIEDAPAIALWAGSTGACTPVRLEPWRGPDGWVVPGLPPRPPQDAARTMVLLGDPYSFDAEPVIEAVGRAWPELTVVGGLVSGASAPGSSRLLLDGASHTNAAVGVILPPELMVRAIVSQGTRPIGEPFVVTRRHDNVIVEMGGKTALARLDDLVAAASPEERSLLARGLNLGVVIDERKEHFERGDFLVRAVLGAERSTGGIAIATPVEVGATAQFHVRDATTADEDLRLAVAGPPADGALLFTCIGRGTGLFGSSDHDASLVHEAVGRGAVAGMFSSAELGPVGGTNFVHGYTAAALLFGR
jgi:small ligand-binding sensory domain FIST